MQDIEICNNLKSEQCPVCNSSEVVKVGNIVYKNSYYSTVKVKLLNTPEFWHCNLCRSGFVQNIVPEKCSAELYRQGLSDKRWGNVDFTASKTKTIIQTLNKFLANNKTVLDIGCGSGVFLDFAKSKGCQTHGVEYSESSLEFIKSKGHIGYPNLTSAPDYFDIITGIDVIEHLYDLPSFLNLVSSKLSKQGYAIFVTGNISCLSALIAKEKWWYASFPEHIVFPSLNFWKMSANFEVVEYCYTYAASEYEPSIALSIIKSLGKLMLSRYNGLPSLLPDHYLVVLQNRY